MYQQNDLISADIASYCCDFLDTFGTDAAFTSLLGIDACLLHQPKNTISQCFTNYHATNAELSCRLERVARTFVGRGHNRGKSVEKVNNEYPETRRRTDQNIHVLTDITLRMRLDNLLDSSTRVKLLTSCHWDELVCFRRWRARKLCLMSKMWDVLLPNSLLVVLNP